MELLDSSSEDECNFYVNAASKLNALNRRDAEKNKDDYNDEEDDDNDYYMVTGESDNVSSIPNDNASEKETNIVNDGYYIEDSENNVEVENLISCVDDDDDYDDDDDDDDGDDDVDVFAYNTRARKMNSNKRKNNIPQNLEPPISIDDSIECELNDTYDDSLHLSQEDNDSYVVIGTPPPSKKFNNDNYEVSIKILWKSNKLERFEIKRYESFQKIFRLFANLENVSEDQILITKKDKRITPFDTPVSINWSIIDILEGGVVSSEILKKNKTNSTQDEEQQNICKIKVQTSDKRTLIITLKNDEPFTSLIEKCSEQLKVPEMKIKLYFDGELIDTDETPKSLELDEEACVDLKISK